MVQQLLEEVRVSRNSIAHCKFFYNEEFTKSKKAISKLNKAVAEAIRLTEEKDFLDQNDETIKLIAESMVKAFEGYKEIFSQITVNLSSSLSKVNEIIAPITETFSRTFEDITKVTSGLYEKFQPLLESLPDNAFLSDEIACDSVTYCLEDNDEFESKEEEADNA